MSIYRKFMYYLSPVARVEVMAGMLFLLMGLGALFFNHDLSVAFVTVTIGFGFFVAVVLQYLVVDQKLIVRIRFWRQFSIWPYDNVSTTEHEIIQRKVDEMMTECAKTLNYANQLEEAIQASYHDDSHREGDDHAKALREARQARKRAQQGLKTYKRMAALAESLYYSAYGDYKLYLKK